MTQFLLGIFVGLTMYAIYRAGANRVAQIELEASIVLFQTRVNRFLNYFEALSKGEREYSVEETQEVGGDLADVMLELVEEIGRKM